ncbi:hypothetical protein PR048_029088 [Dryococelus australis]|uniref:Uncharacterized protein n=1 Tax=Dryococelus australis TaxID=614101 RepID=A0ABQ9GD00_9NEOP|nr:hypothetical protein PR048_029088 [Dryococelus australis]
MDATYFRRNENLEQAPWCGDVLPRGGEARVRDRNDYGHSGATASGIRARRRPAAILDPASKVSQCVTLISGIVLRNSKRETSITGDEYERSWKSIIFKATGLPPPSSLACSGIAPGPRGRGTAWAPPLGDVGEGVDLAERLQGDNGVLQVEVALDGLVAQGHPVVDGDDALHVVAVREQEGQQLAEEEILVKVVHHHERPQSRQLVLLEQLAEQGEAAACVRVLHLDQVDGGHDDAGHVKRPHLNVVDADAARRRSTSSTQSASRASTMLARYCKSELLPRVFLQPLSPPHLQSRRATAAERLARSRPTKANRVQSPAGSSDFRKWESCRTMPLVSGFSRVCCVCPAPSFRRRSIFTSITLIGSQDLAVKSHPNLFTHSLAGLYKGVGTNLGVLSANGVVYIQPIDDIGQIRLSADSEGPLPNVWGMGLAAEENYSGQ